MTTEHPAKVQDISRDWLSGVLEECGFLDGARIRAFKNEPFDPGAGQLSAITRIRLDYDHPTDLPGSLVLKFHAPTQDAHELSMRYRVYERERRFFSDVAASSALPVPICHAAVVDEEQQRFILFLEDLGGMDFVDQLDGADYDHAVRVVRALARLHASTSSPEMISQLEWMPYVNGEVNQSAPTDFRKNWPKYRDKYGPTNPAGAARIGEELSGRFSELLERQAQLADELGIQCVCHGDSRLDNIAFDPSGDGVYLFDWQLSFKNMGPTDVSYFLGGSLSTDLRRETEQRLVQLYHDELCDLGVDNMSLATCWDLYRFGHLYYLMYMVTGGTETDVENARSFKLFQVASQRQFTAALDHNSLEILDANYQIAR